jgi:hypothetical protein
MLGTAGDTRKDGRKRNRDVYYREPGPPSGNPEMTNQQI